MESKEYYPSKEGAPKIDRDEWVMTWFTKELVETHGFDLSVATKEMHTAMDLEIVRIVDAYNEGREDEREGAKHRYDVHRNRKISDWSNTVKHINKFKRRDKVCKPKGYAFDGIVVSVFTNTKGEVRIVAELEGNGMLHIFSESQLELRGNGE